MPLARMLVVLGVSSVGALLMVGDEAALGIK